MPKVWLVKNASEGALPPLETKTLGRIYVGQKRLRALLTRL